MHRFNEGAVLILREPVRKLCCEAYKRRGKLSPNDGTPLLIPPGATVIVRKHTSKNRVLVDVAGGGGIHTVKMSALRRATSEDNHASS